MLIVTCIVTATMFLILVFLIAAPKIQLFFCNRELDRINARFQYLKRQGNKMDQIHKRSVRFIKIYNERERQYRYWRNQ